MTEGTRFAAAVRWIFSLALRLFFRVAPPAGAPEALATPGPVIFVANHPNGLVDPALVFTLAKRPVTFLAKAPLFRLPVLGWLLRGVQALPVHRAQDGADTSRNEGVLRATEDALVAGRAVSLFPEGKSHSEPQLAALKTGCARIALSAAARGAAVRIVPLGLTYADKRRFRSLVQVAVGAPLEVRGFSDGRGAESREAVQRLTDAVADALRAVTVQLETWEDLPLLETAEALFALSRGEAAGQAERQRAFARGLRLVREEAPERFAELSSRVAAYRRRLDLLRLRGDELEGRYHPAAVARFAVRNLAALAVLPAFAVGMALFALPYWVPAWAAAAYGAEEDVESTVKLLTAMVVAPLWWAAVAGAAAALGGWGWSAAAAAAVPPLALFTRRYFEGRRAALHDARAFLLLLRRQRLAERLRAEGRALAEEISRLAEALGPRVTAA